MNSKKILSVISALSVIIAPLLSLVSFPAQSLAAHGPVFVSMTNNSTGNALVTYSPDGQLLGTFSTNGKGGAGGNGGAVQTMDNLVAVPDFGSNDVAIFTHNGNNFKLQDNISTSAAPVSLAFGGNHLYVLETNQVESFKLKAPGKAFVKATWDGSVAETKADGSAGQIGYLTDGHVIYTEKSGAVSEISLNSAGGVTGSSVMVTALPSDLNTPLGLATQGNIAVVTNAHGTTEQEMLVVNGAVAVNAPGADTFANGSADCWNAIYGQFVYSGNSPKMQLDRFVFSQNSLSLNQAGVASVSGAPTDVAASSNGLVATIYNGNLSIYQADSSGNLTLLGSATSPTGTLNGAAWSE